MDFFFILIFIVVVLNILSSIGEKGIKKKKANNPWKSGQDQRPMSESARQQLRTHTEPAQNTFGKRNAASIAARQAKNVASHAAADVESRRLRDRRDSRASNRKDIADMNRARVGNWGHRVGPGFLTLTNIFVLFALLMVGLYIWGQIEGNF